MGRLGTLPVWILEGIGVSAGLGLEDSNDKSRHPVNLEFGNQAVACLVIVVSINDSMAMKRLPFLGLGQAPHQHRH